MKNVERLYRRSPPARKRANTQEAGVMVRTLLGTALFLHAKFQA
jgi:hypothetical protein